MNSKPPVDYFGTTVPFMEHIGLVPVTIRPDHASTSLPFRQALANRSGYVHGGMLMSALDFAMSAAARSTDLSAIRVSTIDMNTSFLAPAEGDLIVEARCLRRGKSIAFCEGDVRDGAGELVARASGTFKLMRTAPTG